MGRFGRALTTLVVIGAVGAGAYLYLTRPQPYTESDFAEAGEPDIKNGEMMFWAGGCVSCHASPDAEGDAQLVLSGGLALKSPFGTFYPPNISPDPDAGIGNWTLAEFASAMKRGVGRNGEHLYPSLPYTSYVHMSDADIRDLFAYMKTLPKSSNVTAEHDLPFPFNIRLALGGWKFLYFNDNPRVVLSDASEAVKRGQYLVEGPGHCGECHTPRDFLGGWKTSEWLAGAPNPEGEGVVPNITPGGAEVGDWSAKDIAYYLESGFTPDFDSVGGSMVEVQRNMAHLTAEDREAIAAYLKAIPAH
ncbi:cytochrome c [Rhizobium sp. L1K21]|uniref:cytochrome c n=1 Tax=Rhizobium sp. L1K21 TaxID=2954933 RepID=UPI002092F103|nr:cytochrome c [Rhizobium sp. L1K21]MCO6185681.1 cytochrome c [Rhizobium sp. L1K21]